MSRSWPSPGTTEVSGSAARCCSQPSAASATWACASASLSVHARNEAGKRLYESVGMTVAWRAERWEKALDA